MAFTEKEEREDKAMLQWELDRKQTFEITLKSESSPENKMLVSLHIFDYEVLEKVAKTLNYTDDPEKPKMYIRLKN